MAKKDYTKFNVLLFNADLMLTGKLNSVCVMSLHWQSLYCGIHIAIRLSVKVHCDTKQDLVLLISILELIC